MSHSTANFPKTTRSNNNQNNSPKTMMAFLASLTVHVLIIVLALLLGGCSNDDDSNGNIVEDSASDNSGVPDNGNPGDGDIPPPDDGTPPPDDGTPPPDDGTPPPDDGTPPPDDGTPPPDDGTPPPDDGGNAPVAGLSPPFDTENNYNVEIYVDGSQANNGDGSFATPYNSIASALQNAQPGYRIHIRAGTYPAAGSFGNLQGQSDAPIAIVADGDVIIDAGGNGNGMALQDARYVVIDGLTIQNTGVHGLNIDDGGSYVTPSEYVVLRNMHFRNIGNGGNNDCLKMSGVNHFHVESSEFEGCNRGEAIDMVGCHNGTITGNYVHDVIINGFQTKGGSSDILIHGNRFEDIPQRGINAGGNTGDPYFRPDDAMYEAQDITIIANIFVRTGSAPVVYAGCLNCIVANNTIIEPSSYVFRVLQENSTKGLGENGYFLNNIVVFNDADLSNYTFFNSNGGSLDNTFTIDANLWYAMDNPGFNTIPNGTGFSIGNNGIIQQDPELDTNYRLSTTSPAIGQGIVVPGGVIADYDGNSYSDPLDMGAFRAP